MHPTLMSVMVAERNAELRASAASHRRGRIASRIRPRIARRPRARLAHA